MKDPTYLFFVAGVQYRPFDPVRLKINVDDPLTLVPEPDNEHDPHAVQVLTEHTTPVHLGYVPRHISKELAVDRAHGWVHHATLHRYDPLVPPWEMISVRVTSTKK